ncbi:MAG: AEC family transporter [bacterium]|jgi:predicted permease
MNVLTLLLPDFLLILLGYLLIRITDWGNDFWAGLEKLVYFVLFPALLFVSTSRTPLDFHATGKLLQVALIAVASGIALGWLAKPIFKPGHMIFESGVQTAFRFNSYIGLAVSFRLGGEQATSLMALIIGFAVPIANMAAVHALAYRNKGNLLAEMAKNPLLLATASGTLFNVSGGVLPEVATLLLSRMGSASIALGLLMVGAGLKLKGLSEARGISAYFIGVKLIVLPAIALVLSRAFELPPLQMQIAVMFCALPTASSAYVLAARMGGNAPLVAFLISAGTLLSIVTLPLWLLFAG